MNVAIIGMGLIGGSMALVMKAKGIASKVMGVDQNIEHCQKAIELGLVDEILEMNEAIKNADLIVLAIPVDEIIDLLPGILNKVDKQVLMDVGSTKAGMLNSIKNHPKKCRFVGTHPMWGTEFSGPQAARKDAFINKAVVICNKEACDKDAIIVVESLYKTIGMHVIYMNAADHDVHVAYVSHISHITSFALANTVLEKEKEEDAIFELASGGFESTVRLAKSNPETWASIFLQNKENVLDVLNEHINQLQMFKLYLETENHERLENLMSNANKINRILK